MATQPESAEPQSPLWNKKEGEPRHNAMPALTEEERLVLKECDREGFFKRALPLSLGTMLGAHMLVKGGYWSPNPKYGSLPKVMALGACGYFFGKLSYLSACQEKILQKIPNSNLAIQIRKAKGMPEQDTAAATWDSASAGISSLRIQDDYAAPEGLDDRFRPTIDRDVKKTEGASQEKSSVTYDELRQRNRQEYKDQIAKAPPPASGFPSYKDIPQKSFPDAKTGDSGSSIEPSQASPPKKRTNMWGDPIE
ncbi:hypothetical protein BsWGS_17901 [Bradybaena similaris]